jgi:hypothetical protein
MRVSYGRDEDTQMSKTLRKRAFSTETTTKEGAKKNRVQLHSNFRTSNDIPLTNQAKWHGFLQALFLPEKHRSEEATGQLR